MTLLAHVEHYRHKQKEQILLQIKVTTFFYSNVPRPRELGGGGGGLLLLFRHLHSLGLAPAESLGYPLKPCGEEALR